MGSATWRQEMPDLATHACAQVLFTRPRKALPHALLGALLPDLLTRGPNIVWPWLGRQLMVLHQPIGLLLLSILIAQLYRPERRLFIIRWFLFGAACHLALDFLQWSYSGSYYWLYPFSLNNYQLGLFGPEDSLLALPILLPLLLVGLYRRRNQAQIPQQSPNDPDSPQ